MNIVLVSATERTREIGVRMAVGAALLVLPGDAIGQANGRKANQLDSFFIVSPVDAKKSQIVLKWPTEVTEVVEVTPATPFRDEV